MPVAESMSKHRLEVGDIDTRAGSPIRLPNVESGWLSPLDKQPTAFGVGDSGFIAFQMFS